MTVSGPVDPLETELEAIARHLRSELGAEPPAESVPPSREPSPLVLARFLAAFLLPCLCVVGLAMLLGLH